MFVNEVTVYQTGGFGSWFFQVPFPPFQRSAYYLLMSVYTTYMSLLKVNDQGGSGLGMGGTV